MKFLDANVFIYAYYKPKQQLTGKILEKKKEAKKIIEKFEDEKEELVTTVVHISEIINILKRGINLEELLELMTNLLVKDNIEVITITPQIYMDSIEISKKFNLDPNDAIAVFLMREKGIKEIYTFDKDFDNIPEIIRIPKID